MTTKKRKCKNCYYWVIIENWGELTQKKDLRIMGYCYLEPPLLMQNIVPSIVRERGLNSLFENSEHFQHTPITEDKRFCQHHKFKKGKDNVK